MTAWYNIPVIEEQKASRVDYLIILFLICCSGFPTFIFTTTYSLSVLFLLASFYFIHTKQRVDKYFTRTIILLLVITIAHFFQFDYLALESMVSLLIIFISSYFIIKIFRMQFLFIYVRLMVIITVLSFFFYLIILLSPEITEFIITKIAPVFQVSTGTFFDHPPTILVYVFNYYDEGTGLYRNSGPFWEPGAFGGFLVIALIFNLLIERKVFSKRSIILILGIITTFSTTSYIALSLLLFFYATIRTSFITKMVLIPIFLAGILYLYDELPFLGEKIDLQYSSLSTSSVDYQQRTRFVSAMLDMYDFMEYPVWGRGKSDVTRFTGYASYAGELKHRNNGLTDFLAQYGSFGFIFFFGTLLVSLSKLSKYFFAHKSYAVFLLLIILAIGFSEKYYNRPLFVCLPFLFIIFIKSKKHDGIPNLYKHSCS